MLCLCGGGGMSSLLFLPHPGISPAQSAVRVWPRGGSDAKGRSQSALPSEGVLVGRSEQKRKRNEGEKEYCVWKTVGFLRRARSGFEARETKAS